MDQRFAVFEKLPEAKSVHVRFLLKDGWFDVKCRPLSARSRPNAWERLFCDNYTTITMRSSSPVKIEHLWRNDITGLRAVAVLPVLLFHAFPNLLPGGFFGVDVFFVISGYLISGIIFRGLIDGTFSYRSFYEKRIKRILPNLLLLILFVSVMGYFFLLPEEYSNLGKHIYSSAGFFQNFRLLKEIGYFTEDALRKPLLHLWSLAIEEQFYGSSSKTPSLNDGGSRFV